MHHRTRASASIFAFLALTLAALPGWANPPAVYNSPAYESPVRGDPDDLLLISGSGLAAGDIVVYQQLGDTTVDAPTPTTVPTSSTASQGVADLVSTANTPYSLTVHLPAVMSQDRAYGLWVMTPDHQWSTELRINDARPLWITPDSAYQNASLANLPRVLKVVGRNLHPDPAGRTATTRVRLTGVSTGTVYTLTANNTSNDPHTTAALQRYVAAVSLPTGMVVDRYTVKLSRDGISWVPLLGDGQSPVQTLAVNPDPPPLAAAKTFDVSKYPDPLTGALCSPNDGIDDTGCIVQAVRAAQLAGGGTVVFGPGTWLLSNTGSWNGQGYSNRTGWQAGSCPNNTETCGVSYFGIMLPPGVSMQGAGASGPNVTKIERATTWSIGIPLFCLLGGNTVTGFDFTDDNNYLTNYQQTQGSGAPLIQLGVAWYWAWMWSFNDPLAISNVVITNNLFDKPWMAIGNNGLPIDHIYITYNTFGGVFATAIGISEFQDNVWQLGTQPTPFYSYSPHQWRDAVVTHNTFYPSSFQVTEYNYDHGAPGGNGTLATGLNSGRHADFSDNTADGTSTQYFYSPTDPKGWRAAFFWTPGTGQEMILVSNNTITCSADKYGDGEAIVFDGNAQRGGVPVAQPVVSATPWSDPNDPNGAPGTAVIVQGVIATQLPSSKGLIDISANPTAYYGTGFWLQVVQGNGQGQWRKVQSVSLGSNGAGPTFTLNVKPALDVLPDGSSKVIIDRSYWQAAVVNNSIDQRTPLCTKANTRAGAGSVISFYASTGDSAMEGNQQFDTSGITLPHTYQPPVPGTTPVSRGGFVIQSHNEIRNNLINGDYNWSGPSGGIQLGFGAKSAYCNNGTCITAPPPPNTGFGVSIAGNTIIKSSARDQNGNVRAPLGAISLGGGWEAGPLDALGLTMWQLDTDTLVFHNTLQDISNNVPGSAGGLPLVGLGVDLADAGQPLVPALSWRTSFYANSCDNVDTPITDRGISNTRYCPVGNFNSCECRSLNFPINLDVGVTATSSVSSVSHGGSATYTVVVTNNDNGNTAAKVYLSLEPSAGVQITGTSFTTSQGQCDSSVNVCMLGGLVAGQSATVTVTGTFPTPGSWPITFSVTHREGDSVPSNNSVTVTESVL